MLLPIIYIGLFIFTLVLFFLKKGNTINYKKWLFYGHVISLLILSIDIFLIINLKTSFKTAWVDRLVVICFLISGAMTFALYYKTIRWWSKIYFGVFFFYPVIAALTFLIDRIFFFIVASPLIVTLLSSDIYCSNEKYEIRTMQGLIAPNRLVLIEKKLLTETEIGISDEEIIGNDDYKNFKLLTNNIDSTTISVYIDGRQTNLTFRK